MFRPKVKRILARVASPGGAFVAGCIVALFLLPCTIGPYFIAGSILAEMSFFATTPWLLFYNVVFVLPMIAITLLVFGGISGVKDLSDWKDRNIRVLHLVSGIIILLLGIVLLFGWEELISDAIVALVKSFM